MTDRGDIPRELDAYLDGALSDSEHAQFESRLADHAEWRDVCDLQSSIDESLRRTLEPDAATARRILDATQGSPARTRSIVWWRPLAAAAVLTLAFVGIWSIVPRGGSGPPPYVARAWQPANAWYTEIETAGSVPDWQCETETIFADFFDDHFAQRLLVRPGSEQDRLLGLSQVHLITPRTMALLTERDDTLILVLIDRLDRDRGIDLPDGGALVARRFEQDDLVIYVVAPPGSGWAFDVYDSVDAPAPQVRLRSNTREAP